jgi:hypothetical protein
MGDRLDPARAEEDARRIIVLVVAVRRLWDEAVSGGAHASGSWAGVRGSGFADADPTYTAFASPTRRQLRGSARYAFGELEQARIRLENAEHALKTGLLRTDPEVLERDLEKRRAATQP